MKNSKHTPGPWFVELDTQTIRYGEQTVDGLNPKSKEVSFFGDQEGNSNARLVAAAPELLEALIIADSQLCELGISLDQIRRAINKAEGKED